MALGLLDLSIVTDRLLKQLNDCVDVSPMWAEEPTPPAGTPLGANPGARFTIYFSGSPPDIAHALDNCQVSLYLFHVAPDKFHRSTFPTGGRARVIPEQPLALTLYYLLSAHSKDYIEEQQAMSIALKCFHDHPVVSATVPIDSRVEEFTLTMEPESVDDIGRLWQSISIPLRLSAVYRASVVFLQPETATRPAPKQVLKPQVAAYPQTVITRAVVEANGRGIVNGYGFTAGTTTVEIDDDLLAETMNDPPGPGEVRFVDTRTLDITLPTGTASGRPHRLRVQNAGEQRALFTVHVP